MDDPFIACAPLSPARPRGVYTLGPPTRRRKASPAAGPWAGPGSVRVDTRPPSRETHSERGLPVPSDRSAPFAFSSWSAHEIYAIQTHAFTMLRQNATGRRRAVAVGRHGGGRR